MAPAVLLISTAIVNSPHVVRVIAGMIISQAQLLFFFFYNNHGSIKAYQKPRTWPANAAESLFTSPGTTSAGPPRLVKKKQFLPLLYNPMSHESPLRPRTNQVWAHHYFYCQWIQPVQAAPIFEWRSLYMRFSKSDSTAAAVAVKERANQYIFSFALHATSSSSWESPVFPH